METAKNLKVICRWEDGSYNCTVDLLDSWTQTWEQNLSYCARAGDPAPVNLWILEQIKTGAYDPIDACPIPATSKTETSNAKQEEPQII
jgi:hypothetical protein